MAVLNHFYKLSESNQRPYNDDSNDSAENVITFPAFIILDSNCHLQCWWQDV